MRRFNTLLVLIGMLMLILSCSKAKPPTGDYWIALKYEKPEVKTLSQPIEITGSSKGTITINDSELDKDGKNIEGKINYVPNTNGIYITGKWSHKLFSKNYKIEGRFTEDYYQGGNLFVYSGTFEIKSN
ncbi:MAG: hypothetical protein GXO89_18095 [Chlorobi bacterium]|nr:hypothetical protein [Chlorobiota bacterium]